MSLRLFSVAIPSAVVPQLSLLFKSIFGICTRRRTTSTCPWSLAFTVFFSFVFFTKNYKKPKKIHQNKKSQQIWKMRGGGGEGRRRYKVIYKCKLKIPTLLHTCTLSQPHYVVVQCRVQALYCHPCGI